MVDVNILRAIALETGQSEASILEIVQDAPRRYKVFPIPKKGHGFRIIAQPARELKPIQRCIASLILSKFPVHAAAMAYRPGVSIADNARIHAGANPILKLDFEKYFNNISAAAWQRFLANQEYVTLSQSDIEFITKALFWGDGRKTPYCLSIGAPTSPLVSNIIMFDFDTCMHKFSVEHGIKYTRYADDITISSNELGKLRAFERHLRSYIKRNKTPALFLNEEKRAIYSPSERRLVTGLILTPEGQISLGRDRKREISALVHKYSIGTLDIERLGYLHGMLAFALSSEPIFVERMRKKYGDEVISAVFRYRVPRKDGSHR
ncbi:retron St85 family RNA-directed DNA polymerase [Hoeflea sp. Naph1]|uniref:retron St85 family RNA-directed DNA polymerase n=1 Tax=Hoeflea sp. Naph1 TaxID=3388653 RepID=UPI00398FDF37